MSEPKNMGESKNNSDEVLLQVKELSVSFHSRDGINHAVKNVSFDLYKGQTLCIVGESGSGKSVSCYSLLGLLPSPPARIEQGQAIFQGQDLLQMSEQQARAIRGGKIAMIFQDPMTSLNPYLTIGSQLIEALLLHEPQSKAQARQKAQLALEEVGIRNAGQRLQHYPHEFSGGMRQRVMIAMALIAQPQLLIADEPTTALDVTIQAQILALISKLQQEKSLSVIFITHDLAVAEKIGDQVLVMNKGEIVERGSPGEIFNSPQQPYTQALIDAIPKTAKATKFDFSQSEKILSIENLQVQFPLRHRNEQGEKIFRAVNDVSLDLYKGEIYGLVGESGSGKTTLGKSILRLVPINSGRISLNGTYISSLQAKELEQARADFQMIFQDPYASLNPRMTVYDTLCEPLLLQAKLTQQQLLEAVTALLDDVGLKQEDMLKYPHEFSGGQRQRIAIARALAMKPKLIIADEPVSALDVTIQAQVLDLLINLVKRYELTMLFISHDMAVIRYLCDRVAVMKNGKLIEQGLTEEVFTSAKEEYTQNLLSSII